MPQNIHYCTGNFRKASALSVSSLGKRASTSEEVMSALRSLHSTSAWFSDTSWQHWFPFWNPIEHCIGGSHINGGPERHRRQHMRHKWKTREISRNIMELWMDIQPVVFQVALHQMTSSQSAHQRQLPSHNSSTDDPGQGGGILAWAVLAGTVYTQHLQAESQSSHNPRATQWGTLEVLP